VYYYKNGSSKDVERWLSSNLNFFEMAYPLHVFKGNVSEMQEMAAARTIHSCLNSVCTRRC
jgi:hypothetical protein